MKKMVNKMMVGAIDIGTNSVRLLIAERGDRCISARQKEISMTRIGKDVDRMGQLREDRIQDTIKVLVEYKKKLLNHGITSCFVFATSAVRDAYNQQNFIDRVKEATGYQVTVLSGEQEAKYGFEGVVRGFPFDSENLLVIDIGGGSTEVIYGSANLGVKKSCSFDIGAVRMTDRYNIAHGVNYSALSTMTQAVKKYLANSFLGDLAAANYHCICIGGTATTLATIDMKMSIYDAERVHNHQLRYVQIHKIAKKLSMMSKMEKLKLTGLAPKRTNIITAGSAILETMLNFLSCESVWISDYDNLEGSLFIQ